MLEVLVVSGGFSSEREISINTGHGVFENLGKRYKKRKVDLWNLDEFKGVLERLDKENLLVFNALHGTFGEDGQFQRLLDGYGVLHTGCSAEVSEDCMDKQKTKSLLKKSGIKVPDYICIEKNDDLGLAERFLGKHKKIVVKPRCEGSSVGVSLVELESDLKPALDSAFQYGKFTIIEEFIEGTELTACVTGNDYGDLQVLPIIEIVPIVDEFFSYESKYSDAGCLHIIPARISDSHKVKAEETAKKVYSVMGCEVYARVDLMATDKDIYVLEVNTLPGLTKVSLFPDSAKAAGISYSELLDEIIELSLKKQGVKVV